MPAPDLEQPLKQVNHASANLSETNKSPEGSSKASLLWAFKVESAFVAMPGDVTRYIMTSTDYK